MKYCEDCKWHGNEETSLMLCHNPNVGMDYRATPVFKPVPVDTGNARDFSALCGAEGRWWEAKDGIQ
jgi:hypothetical protein